MRLLVITTMRNEGPFIVEWVAHLRALGVTDILVYSNDCDDGTEAVLDALDAAVVLTHRRHAGGGKSVQWRALRAAKKEPVYKTADWVACLDCDEFPALAEPFTDLPSLISAADADAIVLPWRLFGSSGRLHTTPSPVTETFMRAAPEHMLFPAAGRFFKTLYRRQAFARPGIHRPERRQSAPLPKWVDGGLCPLPPDFAERDRQILLHDPAVNRDAVALNHYSVKSAEDFLIKRRRGLPNRASKPLDASYWAERNFNTVEDTRIARHASARNSSEEVLLSLTGVKAAQFSAEEAHRRQIEACLKDPDTALLYTRLALLPGSVPPDTKTAKQLSELMSRSRP